MLKVKKQFLRRIENSKTYLERKPLETTCKDGELMAFKHRGFWQCLDTKRDLDLLIEILVALNLICQHL